MIMGIWEAQVGCRAARGRTSSLKQWPGRKAEPPLRKQAENEEETVGFVKMYRFGTLTGSAQQQSHPTAAGAN